MNRQTLSQQLLELIGQHIPSNATRFKYCIYDDKPHLNALGLSIDPKPFDGKVIAKTDEAIIIKTGRCEFAVLDRQLVSFEPNEGTNVQVEPYARRRFDGLRADTPEQEMCKRPDGSTYSVTRQVIGRVSAKLPIPKPQCYALEALITYLEEMPAPDGIRCITHMLVDANAKNLQWVDPTDENICETPPAIEFTVSTKKFEGQVKIVYERGGDVYAIELRCGDNYRTRVDDVYFDELGKVLYELIDDGEWKRINVHPLSRK